MQLPIIIIIWKRKNGLDTVFRQDIFVNFNFMPTCCSSQILSYGVKRGVSEPFGKCRHHK